MCRVAANPEALALPSSLADSLVSPLIILSARVCSGRVWRVIVLPRALRR